VHNGRILKIIIVTEGPLNDPSRFLHYLSSSIHDNTDQ